MGVVLITVAAVLMLVLLGPWLWRTSSVGERLVVFGLLLPGAFLCGGLMVML
jgi:hypothetical protein